MITGKGRACAPLFLNKICYSRGYETKYGHGQDTTRHGYRGNGGIKGIPFSFKIKLPVVGHFGNKI